MRWLLTWVAACFVGSLSLLLAQPPAEQPKAVVGVAFYNPDTSVKFAAADILTVPPEERPFIRYLSLYNVPKAERKKYAAIVSFMVNSLGTRRQMYIPLFVGGSDETVIRLNIDDYEWNAKIWDKLAANGSGVKPTPEPYFQSFIEKLEKQVETKTITKKVTKRVPVKKQEFIGYYQGRPLYKTITVYENQVIDETIDEKVEGDPIKKRILSAGAWVDPDAIALLQKETHAVSPILRADWFLANAMLPPAYYDFLRLGKNIKDFENLLFANQELAQKARSQDKGIVVLSSVTRNNRTLLRSPTFTGGYYWISHDSLSSVEERQYVQNILNEKFDATEDIGSLPNGLQAYFLTDGVGARLDFANPDVAIDNGSIDRVVRNGRSCIVCHSDGIRPINDEIRALTKKLLDPNEIKLLITKKEDARKIQDLFGSNLDEQIIKDQNYYAAAIGRVNGLSPVTNAKWVNEVYNNYVEIVLVRETVARELGVPEKDLDIYLKLSNDPVVLGLLRSPIRAVRRDQWERSFQQLMLIVKLRQPVGIVPPQIVAPTHK